MSDTEMIYREKPIIGPVISYYDIPAWSLHRLMELKEPNTIDNELVILSRKQTYDKLIGIIAKSIKEEHFNKEYLEE